MGPSLRFDSLTDEWVAFAPGRSKRPHQLGTKRDERVDDGGECPFCPGHEGLTAAEQFRIGSAEDWRVRVVENLFPAFSSTERDVTPSAPGGSFQERPSAGVHEVVVESPNHFDDLKHLRVEQVEDLLRALHARYCALAQRGTLAAVVIFKNKGASAGTSLRHPHWQIIGTPVIPPRLERKLSVARAHHRRFGRCLYSETLNAEEALASRVIASDAHYVCFAPFASSMPFQAMVLPRVRRASWEQVPLNEILPLASLLPDVLRRLDAELGEPDFNIAVTCGPPSAPDDGSFCWHIDVLPRTTLDAGFELASGMRINTVLPEAAASALRRALPNKIP